MTSQPSLTSIVSTLTQVATNSIKEAGAIAKEALALTQQRQSNQLADADYQELMDDLAAEKLAMVAADEFHFETELAGVFALVKGAVSFIP